MEDPKRFRCHALEFAEPACLNRVHAAWNLVLCKERGRIDSQVSQIVGAPEHDTLTQTAWAGAAKKNSAFQFRYQRLKTRRAVKRATIAVAHAQLGSGGRKNPAADRS